MELSLTSKLSHSVRRIRFVTSPPDGSERSVSYSDLFTPERTRYQLDLFTPGKHGTSLTSLPQERTQYQLDLLTQGKNTVQLDLYTPRKNTAPAWPLYPRKEHGTSSTSIPQERTRYQLDLFTPGKNTVPARPLYPRKEHGTSLTPLPQEEHSISLMGEWVDRTASLDVSGENRKCLLLRRKHLVLRTSSP